MNTMEYVRSEEGFNAIQKVFDLPAIELPSHMRGSGYIRLSLRGREDERASKLSLDFFLETPLEDVPLLMNDKRGCISELANLRLQEALDV